MRLIERTKPKNVNKPDRNREAPGMIPAKLDEMAIRRGEHRNISFVWIKHGIYHEIYGNHAGGFT